MEFLRSGHSHAASHHRLSTGRENDNLISEGEFQVYNSEKPPPSKARMLKRWWRHRAVNVLSLMVFWGQMQNYMMRLNLGILIVAMVDDDALAKGGKNVTVAENCGYDEEDGISTSSTDAE